MGADPGFGALVISLDLELHWGVRDHVTADGAYAPNLHGARHAIPRILALFREFDVAATWATVGFLFARSRTELNRFSPSLRPRYVREALNPYDEPLGTDEVDDPVHFGPSLIDLIRRTPGQEIATHTFSHYYCRAAGQTRDTFRADLKSAIAIAAERGIGLQSIVFPKNQYNSEYDDVLRELGIICYRGNPDSWMYQPTSGEEPRRRQRAARMLDAYLPLRSDLTAWSEVPRPAGLCDVAATHFLRPYTPRLRHLENVRRVRITRAIEGAARHRQIAHLWWHPHNFGRFTEENLAVLRSLLECFDRCREDRGLRSLSMKETADVAMQVSSPEV